MIEGTLVRLRAIDMEDVDRYTEWFNDPEVTRHLSMRYQFAREAEEVWVRGQTSSMVTYGPLHFAVESKEDGVQIGNVGFGQVLAENRKARLGITIGDKRYWSRGYGTDTMITMCRFGFDEMNLHRIDLTVNVENERAVRCYEKAGFTNEGRLRQAIFARGSYHDQFIMGVLRDEFYSKHPREDG